MLPSVNFTWKNSRDGQPDKWNEARKIRGATGSTIRHLAPVHLTLFDRYGKYRPHDYKATSRCSTQELEMSNTGTRRATAGSPRLWSHPSVLGLAGNASPLEAITARARGTALRAIQSGWSGPPYDPFALAEILKISVEPRQDVMDARTVSVGGGKFRIEFNPNRSRARINFSVAHEIIHTLFPDCAETIRNRFTHAEMNSNDWELEVLCNIGAAEILMPVGSFKIDDTAPISIDTVITLQRKFSVSTEAILLRTAKLTSHQCFVFAAHRENVGDSAQYRIDYAVSSRGWPLSLRTGFHLPASTVAAECTAIGFTAKAEEDWGLDCGAFRVECLGIAPYPGHLYPRVVGVVRPLSEAPGPSPSIMYLRGDATHPRGVGPRIIAQVVNDKAISWGRGFSVAVRKKWPHAQKGFTEWILARKSDFKLGSVHFMGLQDTLELASLVAQHGYGPSLFPRIEYSALEECLSKLALHAKDEHASVHMPRIGCGEAGGDWNIVSEIIDEQVCGKGVEVTVYDLPEATFQLRIQAKGPSTND
jgi:O-acetyl-ADP-ribose deacetylase (regulator of RNase III)